MASALKEWHDKPVLVVTNDGRLFVGTMVGHDQLQNIVLEHTVERIYSESEGVEELELGIYLIRGDSLCVIGHYEDDDSSKHHLQIRAPPLPKLSQVQTNV